MSGERQSEREIFEKAAEIESPDDRSAYLDEACGGDAGLRSAVEELLRLHSEHEDFLEEPALAAQDTIRLPTVPTEGPGEVIGRYKLLQKIGEGGFGVVYMAEQQEPIRRRVALKIIKLGMDTAEVIARFEAERQALAMMDHPNIAKVFDAGATETGRPYFVMELVHGIPITEYCDTNSLSMRERLELFMCVCQAIRHAHQKAVIHRDLKPANVLVTLHDGEPVPKVIDFGIAKAVERPLTERTLFTRFGQFIGTPQYMSPEQAEMSGLGVDTRSDVYSLGVLLYELLTGTTPFEATRLKAAAYDEIRRIIREEEPPKPSTRISTLGDEASEVARNRHTEPGRLGRLMRGDLDSIVMKALEKDRGRRYESASAFAEDIRRHLAGEAISARPRGALREAWRWCRRHWLGLTFAAIAALVSLLALLMATAMVVVETQANARAERHLGELVTPDLRSARVARAAGAIAVDGDLTEWAGVEPVRWTHGDPSAGTLWLCWSEDGLYGAVRAADDAIETDPEQPWLGDGVEVFVEADAARALTHTAHTFQLQLWPATELGPGPCRLSVWRPLTDESSHATGRDVATGVSGAWRRTDDGYALEFRVPPQMLAPAALGPGTELGFTLALRNGDAAQDAAFAGVWSGDTHLCPALWGTITLTDES